MTIDWERYIARITQAAIAGLDDSAPIFTQAAEAKARSNFPGQTTATFAGIFAAVVGVQSSAIEAAAVAAVQNLNPEHVYTEPAPDPPRGVTRLVGSVPTDYINKLEADPKRAFLARTLDEEQTAMAAALNHAIGGAV